MGETEGKKTPLRSSIKETGPFPPPPNSALADVTPQTIQSLQQLATEYIHDAILLESADGKILYANSSIQEVTGWTENEIRKKSFIEWIHPEDRFSALQTIDLCRNKGSFSRIECRILHSSGDYRWMETTINPIINKESLPCQFVFSIRDITLRKGFETALTKSEERFRSLIENSPIGITLVRDGKIIFMNRAGMGIWGFLDAPELLGQPVAILFAPSEKSKISEIHEKRTKGIAVPNDYETLGIRKNGEEFPLQISAAVIHLFDGLATIQYSRDLTHRKYAEASLQESEERLRFALQGNREGLFDWDIETGHLLYSNAYANILDFSADEFDPDVLAWEALLHPEDKPSVMKTLQDHLEGRTDFYESEHRLQTKSGGYLWVYARGQVTKRDPAGKPLRMNGSHCDISKRKQMEEELRSAREELERRVNERTIELQEANTTMRCLLKQRQKDQAEMEENIAANIRGTLLPYLSKLRSNSLNKDQLALIATIEENLDVIMSPFLKNLKSQYPGLTPKEIQIANLIRNGKTSKEIADELNLSARTVDLFRYRIRKKLKLTNSKVNLENYLSAT